MQLDYATIRVAKWIGAAINMQITRYPDCEQYPEIVIIQGHFLS